MALTGEAAMCSASVGGHSRVQHYHGNGSRLTVFAECSKLYKADCHAWVCILSGISSLLLDLVPHCLRKLCQCAVASRQPVCDKC